MEFSEICKFVSGLVITFTANLLLVTNSYIMKANPVNACELMFLRGALQVVIFGFISYFFHFQVGPSVFCNFYVINRREIWNEVLHLPKVTKNYTTSLNYMSLCNIYDIVNKQSQLLYWHLPTRPRPNRWSLILRIMSIRPSIRPSFTQTLTSRPGKQNNGHHAWK